MRTAKLIVIMIIGLITVGCADVESVNIVEESTYEASSNIEETSNNVKDLTLDYNKLSNGKVTEINYKEVFEQEGSYKVLFTHENCEYCVDLWIDAKFEGMYVVDLKDRLNSDAWEYHQIAEIPLIYEIDNKIIQDKCVGYTECMIKYGGVNNDN